MALAYADMPEVARGVGAQDGEQVCPQRHQGFYVVGGAVFAAAADFKFAA